MEYDLNCGKDIYETIQELKLVNNEVVWVEALTEIPDADMPVLGARSDKWRWASPTHTTRCDCLAAATS